jgi:hypothetical protein
MSTEEFLQSHASFMTAGIFSDTVDVKHLGGREISVVPWRSVPAMIERSADPRGVSAEIGRSPIEVFISKADLEEVDEQVDLIRHEGSLYRIAKIVSDDPGGLHLYCVP